MALYSPIINGRMPQVVKGEILNACLLPGCLKSSLKGAAESLSLLPAPDLSRLMGAQQRPG